MSKYFKYLFLLVLPVLLSGQINMDSAYSYTALDSILDVARASKDQKLLADVYFLLANYENDVLSDHRQSFQYYTRSEEYYRFIGDSVQMYHVRGFIADLYRETGRYDEALKMYEEVLAYHQNIENLKGAAYTLHHLSQVYKDKGDLDMEHIYLERSIQENQILQDTLLYMRCLLDRVSYYERLNEVDSALMASFEVFALSEKIKNRDMLVESLFQIGNLNKYKGDCDKSLRYLKNSEDLMKKRPYDDLRLKVYGALAEVYFETVDLENAFMYSQKHGLLNDSILVKDIQNARNHMTVRYQITEKDKDIDQLKIDQKYAEERNQQQKRALYVLTGGLGLLLLLLYYITRFYTQRIQTEKIITQQKEEINQQKIRELEDNMKITSLQSMIEGQEIERERIAKDLHDSLGGLLATIKLQFDGVKISMSSVSKIKAYSNANKLLDTAVEEVRTISRNLQPSALANLGLIPAIKDLVNRFDGEQYPEIDFQYYDVPDKLDNMFALTVYRIVQELLINAIKHANAAEVLLQINKEEEELLILCEDDGVGFDPQERQGKGMGLGNIKSRINYYQGTVSLDSKTGEGTSYLIHLKYE